MVVLCDTGNARERNVQLKSLWADGDRRFGCCDVEEGDPDICTLFTALHFVGNFGVGLRYLCSRYSSKRWREKRWLVSMVSMVSIV
jgi:hypothetical protein